MKRAINVRGAAQILGVHERTIRKLAKEGRIPYFRLDREWRFDPDALRKLLVSEGGYERETPTAAA